MKFLFFVLFALPAFASPPKIKFSYANMFDFVCAKQLDYKIDPKWTEELERRLPGLKAKWQESGTKLLATTQKIVGKPFAEREIAVSFSVCDFPSMSDPLLVNMRYSLASFAEKPLPEDVTVSIIFHEILHRYLDGIVPEDSALLKKYSGESETVRSHLHLLALQKAVYLKLKQDDLLEAVIKKDQSLPNGAYTRAWEIVNELEDFRAFVSELRREK